VSRLNILVAFPYWTPRLDPLFQIVRDELDLLIDSGAFTAAQSGKAIRLDDYLSFIDGLSVKPWRYFTLDVIGDPEGTRHNFDEARRRGYSPVPIFTPGETLEALEEYYDRSDLVGIGGLVTAKLNGINPKAFLKRTLRAAGDRHTHLLGLTSVNALKSIKPYSCDSSNWESGSRFGNVAVYVGQGRFESITKKSFAAEKPPDHVLRAIEALGFDPYLLLKRENWHGGRSCARYIGCASWVAASLDIERNLGTKLFLAASAAKAMIVGAYLYQTTGSWQGFEPWSDNWRPC
jgi:hypothetical protein